MVYNNLKSEEFPVGNISVNEAVNMNYNFGSGLYCYSFALNPTDNQPSGSLNFSKLDKSELKIRVRRNTSTTGNKVLKQKMLKLYAVNYNVLRFMSGHAGLLFNN